MKKYLLLMFLSLLTAIQASAYDFKVKNDDGKEIYYSYTTDHKAVYVDCRSYGANELAYTGDVVIPETVVSPKDQLVYSVCGIGLGAFQECANMTSLTLPSSIVWIDYAAFSGCAQLTTLELPSSVRSIERQTFSGCDNLTSIVIPPLVTKIPNEMFQSCRSLTSVTIPPSVTSIGDKAFAGCTKLTTLSIPSSVTSVGEDAFLNAGICQNPEYLDGAVLYIDKCLISVWQDNFYLPASYTVKEGTVVIADKAFSLMNHLTDITLPSSLVTIGKIAFQGCSSLTSVTIPGKVATIGQGAFQDCTSLTSVSIPSSVTSIGAYAFYEIAQSGEVSVDNDLPESIQMGNDVFNEDLLNEYILYVPEGTVGQYESLSPWDRFGSIMGKPVANAAFDFMEPNADGKPIYYRKKSDGTLAVSFRTYDYNSYSGNVVIPETVVHDGTAYTVSDIYSNAFAECPDLYSVTIPATIDEPTGATIFLNCTSLKEVNLPDGLQWLPGYMFKNCTSLESVEMPASVAWLMGGNFQGCESLKSVTIRGRESDSSVALPDGITSIGADMFNGCKSLKSINVPSTVTWILDRAFKGCESLSFITIPAGVTRISYQAFKDCTGLHDVNSEIVRPDQMERVAADIFDGISPCLMIPKGSLSYYTGSPWDACSTIFEPVCDFVEANADGAPVYYSFTDTGKTAVTVTRCTPVGNAYRGDLVIPATVNHGGTNYPVVAIDEQAFMYCYDLNSVVIGDNVTEIADFTFRYGSTHANITSVTLGKSVTKIGQAAFSGCTALASVTVPSSLTTIMPEAFYGCSSLKSFNFPKAITYVGMSAFKGSGLETAIFSSTNDFEIRYQAFKDCKNLKSVVLPGANIDMESQVFYGCDAIEKVTLESKNPSYYGLQYVFEDAVAAGATLYVPNGWKTKYSNNSIWKKFGTIEEMEYCWAWRNSGRDWYYLAINDDNSTMRLVSRCNAANPVSGELLLPAGFYYTDSSNNEKFYKLTTIGESAYAYCSDLTEVSQGENLTTIGRAAFVGCENLTAINIPNSITTIGDLAFAGCDAATSLNIGNSLTAIGNRTFANCESITSVTIPSSVTSIGDDAFSRCYSLEVATIGNSVTSIGNYAFFGCSGLNEITIGDAVRHIGAVAFTYTAYYSDDDNWTDDVLYLGNYLLANRDMQESPYAIKEGTLAMADYALAGSSLTAVTFPASLTAIPSHGFYNATSLQTVNIPSTIETVGERAFETCLGLTEVTIPASVTAIGEKAFAGCEKLDWVYSKNTNPANIALGSDVFADIKAGCELYVPQGSVSAYSKAAQWKDFAPRIFAYAAAGDANGDGEVDASDIAYAISFMLGSEPTGFIEDAADMDGDGDVNAADIAAIITAILSK